MVNSNHSRVFGRWYGGDGETTEVSHKSQGVIDISEWLVRKEGMVWKVGQGRMECTYVVRVRSGVQKRVQVREVGTTKIILIVTIRLGVIVVIQFMIEDKKKIKTRTEERGWTKIRSDDVTSTEDIVGGVVMTSTVSWTVSWLGGYLRSLYWQTVLVVSVSLSSRRNDVVSNYRSLGVNIDIHVFSWVVLFLQIFSEIGVFQFDHRVISVVLKTIHNSLGRTSLNELDGLSIIPGLDPLSCSILICWSFTSPPVSRWIVIWILGCTTNHGDLSPWVPVQ